MSQENVELVRRLNEVDTFWAERADKRYCSTRCRGRRAQR
jgi:hypothetical protein